MEEQDVFGYLDGGSITKEDRRRFSSTNAWAVYISDSTDIEIECYGATRDDAWSRACTELMEIIHDRERIALEEHPSMTAGERNPSMGGY